MNPNKYKYKDNFYIFSPFNLSTTETRFYYRKVEDLQEKLLLYFANKTYPKIFTKIRTNTLFVKIFHKYFRQNKYIPDNNVFLIYEGRDSTIYFCKKDKKLYLLREKGSSVKKEKFKGFPIHYDFSSTNIENKELIIDVLKKHLESLKSERIKLHGDFTVYNILVSKDGYISIIDDRINRNKSILTDHFSFYIVFLRRIKRHNFFNIRRRRRIETELENIFLQVFKNEDYKILEEIEKITSEDLPAPGPKKTFNINMIKFRKLLESAIN